MADIKIIDLVEKTDVPSNDDLLVIEDGKDTKKITLQKLKGALSMDSILDAVKKSLEEKIVKFLESHSERMKELEKKNYDLETLCHNLENDHDHDSERIQELYNQLHEYIEKEEELSSQRNDLLKRIKALEAIRDTLQKGIKELSDLLKTDTDNVTILISKVKDLQLKVKELKKLNEELKDRIEEVNQGLMDSNNEAFTEANDYIRDAIKDLETIIKFYHPDAVFE